jgi:hypothetical protein
MLDALGNLTAICEQQERQIELLEKEITRLITEQTTTTITKQPSFWEKMRASIPYTVITVLILVFLVVFLNLDRFGP